VSLYSWLDTAESSTDAGEDELAALAHSLLQPFHDRRRLESFGIWTFSSPVDAALPRQGWKLHVSATTHSATQVLRSAVPVLLERRAAFKFVNAMSRLALLNAPTAPLASAGKFITVYPETDTHAVELARALDTATGHCSGPLILSDRPVRAHSLVHYRYGAFQSMKMVDNDGRIVDAIRGPDGTLIRDERSVPFRRPDWIDDPFEAVETTGGRAELAAARELTEVLLDHRYAVQRALVRRNKGGVYAADDRHTGQRVVVKEGRPHAGGRATGDDARTLIHHEARMLRRVAPLQIAPRLVATFDQQGHAFLVEEHIDGTALRSHAATLMPPRAEAWQADRLMVLVRSLAEAMRACHASGVLLRDFTPDNVMVTPDGRVRIIDLELSTTLDGDAPAPSGGTPGYCSPEQRAGNPPSFADDHYSLGATIAYAATGIDPWLIPDGHPSSRTVAERVGERLARMARDGHLPDVLVRVVSHCMSDAPAERWSPRTVLRVMSEREPRVSRHRSDAVSARERALPDEPDLVRAASDACAWLVRHAQPGRSDELWPTSCRGRALDPCCVHTGAAGVGLVLCRAARSTGADVYRQPIADAVRWITDRLRGGPRRAPGLYVGLAGISWFLAEAADALGADELREQGAAIASRLPAVHANPDVTHGTAGIGMAQLRQWLATGDGRFLARADEAADQLVRSAQPDDVGCTWKVADDFPSVAAGRTMYGFAHGSAGICYFLLCAARATSNRRYLEVAREGLEVVVRGAHLVGGHAAWHVGPDRSTPPMVHWCHGSSGIGTTLSRAYLVTGDARYLRLAELAAEAVVRSRWAQSLVQCHGISGNAELLLDLHDLLGSERHAALARRQLAEVVWAHRVRIDDRVVFPGEDGRSVTAEYSVGLAGIASFLLRLTRGGPRLLMLDELLAPATDTEDDHVRRTRPVASAISRR
jgi:predicted Ser/Thr protein kinase